MSADIFICFSYVGDYNKLRLARSEVPCSAWYGVGSWYRDREISLNTAVAMIKYSLRVDVWVSLQSLTFGNVFAGLRLIFASSPMHHYPSPPPSSLFGHISTRFF